MLTTYASVYKTWVFSERNASFPVGRLIDFVIHPDTGIFEALWLETPQGLRLISVKDILRWDQGELIITSEQDLLKPKEFPRIKPILDLEIPIMGAKVFAETSYVGKVKDFAFDTISPRILSLKVRSGWWVFGTEVMIPRNRIVKIDPKGIWVSNTVNLNEKEGKKEILKPQILDSDRG